MSYDQVKASAWERLIQGKWFWKLFGGALLLQVATQAIGVVLAGILGRMGLMNWQDYIEAIETNRSDLVTPVPELTREFILTATATQGVEWFVGLILYGVTAFGASVILLRCLEDDQPGWLGAAFHGFKYPFALLWLTIRQLLIMLGWTCLALIPAAVPAALGFYALTILSDSNPTLAAALLSAGLCCAALIAIPILCVPFYRYRFLWLVKAEHPDWTAGECLAATRKLMDGHKMESFKLDVSYWKPITGVLALALLAVAGGALLAVATSTKHPGVAGLGVLILGGAILAYIPAALVLSYYISVGQGFFYRELSASDDAYRATGSNPVTVGE